MKKILGIITALTALFSVTAVYADSCPPQVYIDTKKIEFTENTGMPFTKENRSIMIPLRTSMEALGASVTWQSEAETAVISKNGGAVSVKPGEKYILKNGVSVEIDEPPVAADGKIYLSANAAAMCFGNYTFHSNELNKTFILTDKYIQFRDMFTYEGELSKYVNTVVVLAKYNGSMTDEKFSRFWNSIPEEKLKILLMIIAADKKNINPEYDIHINFWYELQNDEKQIYYLAGVSSVSYSVNIYNPFDTAEINQLNQ